LVASEHAGGVPVGPVVDDEREVGRARALEAGGDTGGPEAPGGRDGHGATPVVGRPVVSGSPMAMVMHCTAAPAVPLARLSTAPTTTSLRASTSTATCKVTTLEPSTAPVVGHWPAGSRCTNGSSA